MNISKIPIFNTDGQLLCHLTYTGDDRIWTVRTGADATISTLMLTPIGAYAQSEVPHAEVADRRVCPDYRINTADADGELCPELSNNEYLKLSNKRIRNASGKQLCKLRLNEADNAWDVTFYGSPYSTILYLYSDTGAYTQLEIPTEELK